MASTSTTAPAAGGLSAAARLARYEAAFVGLQAPFAFVDLDAMWANSADMLSRAAGKPIRVASKSLRCRGLQRIILERDLLDARRPQPGGDPLGSLALAGRARGSFERREALGDFA